MLRNLTIHGFKSIRQETSIEFGKVNLFIGGNGVGKSNILEAIGILSACLGREITSDELNKKGVRLSVPTLFKSAFKNHKLRSNFDLKAKWDSGVSYDVSVSAGMQSEELNFHSELISINGAKVIGRSPHGFTVPAIGRTLAIKEGEIRSTRGIWDVFQHLLPDEKKSVLQNEFNRLEQYAIYSPQTAFLRGTDIESVSVKPVGLSGGGLPKAMTTIFAFLGNLRRNNPELHKVYMDILALVWMPGWTGSVSVKPLNPNIVSSQVKASDSALYFMDKHMHSSRNQLSAYDSSEGTLYLLFMVVLLMHPEAPRVLAVDNIDSALNPKITRKLLETVIRSTCMAKDKSLGEIGLEQVFLTSHNPTSLDAFDLFNDDQRIFVVMRDPEDGSSVIKRLQPPAGATKAEWIKASNGKNLSEMWIEGKIKGALGI
ncbi:hypothetical protein Jab_1c04310 [Janthinobacterium sp. HH01]|uniref:AAA family ATPase n=1 Tax=Janthinobacterium sp. HH01 TaxID=1198452 RepID=UPI0002AE7E93|nr:ATP-binding protein [Janthinobacterium sp. HH01]ELX11843.1 hypothetical protein Jab_1c04310 [Janthinobacterium sp. HH01]